MILNKEQAEAVYSAMCAMNNVFGHIERMTLLSRKNEKLTIERRGPCGLKVHVWRDFAKHDEVEQYARQADFAEAYGLN